MLFVARRSKASTRDSEYGTIFALKITGLIWLDEIVEKLARKHRVEAHEVAELFESSPKFRLVERGHGEGENVYAAMGRTEAGRYLIAFFIWKSDGRALLVSARDMTSSERRHYGRK